MRRIGRLETAATRVIGYVRVSTEEQSASGAGLEAQRAAIASECERRGWVLLEVIEDAGWSAKSLDRPGIREARAKLDTGKADVLMAAKLDRLSRSVKDFCDLMDESMKRSWSLVVLDLAVDTSTPAGRVMANVMASFAQFEREMIGLRTKEALKVKKAQGVKIGRSSDTPKETLDRIHALRSEGLTIRAIADRLNSEGVPTARGGTAWRHTRVHQLLQQAS